MREYLSNFVGVMIFMVLFFGFAWYVHTMAYRQGFAEAKGMYESRCQQVTQYSSDLERGGQYRSYRYDDQSIHKAIVGVAEIICGENVSQVTNTATTGAHLHNSNNSVDRWEPLELPRKKQPRDLKSIN